MVQNHLVTSGKTKLLEIGCGTGGFIQNIVDNRDLVITGSEIYLKGLLYAKKKLPDVEFIQFDVTQGEIRQEFDIIVAFDVLEHIEDDLAAIANINKMLHKGGTFIMTVPQHKFLWSELDEIVKHKRRYSKWELQAKLQQMGFVINYSTSFLFVLFPMMLFSRIFDSWYGKSQSDKEALEKRVNFPKVLNWIFDHLMRIDEALIRSGISLPFGGTLVVVAGKQ
jgi:SAM-dependent methyltransferase